MIHIYYGNGKGKTTAAFGLALRAAGRGKRVIVAQFLKSEDSGERRSMEAVPHVLLLPIPAHMKFLWEMDVVERSECEYASYQLLRDAATLAEPGSVLILDEALGALETDVLLPEDVTETLDSLPEPCEVVLTGRNAPEFLLARADYVTRFQAEKHPFERGVPAREGIEF